MYESYLIARGIVGNESQIRSERVKQRFTQDNYNRVYKKAFLANSRPLRSTSLRRDAISLGVRGLLRTTTYNDVQERAMHDRYTT